MVCGIFLIFCWSSFINNFIVKNSFLEPKNQRKLNISRPVYFEKISAHCFVGLICTNKRKGFFFRKKIFSRTMSFFHDRSTTNLASFFSTKIQFYTFSQEWLFNFNIILKTCFKTHLEKLWKNGDFTLLNKLLEPYKVTS